jgi:hypothetical protein
MKEWGFPHSDSNLFPAAIPETRAATGATDGYYIITLLIAQALLRIYAYFSGL